VLDAKSSKHTSRQKASRDQLMHYILDGVSFITGVKQQHKSAPGLFCQASCKVLKLINTNQDEGLKNAHTAFGG
jgi:hypothetical protein